MPFIVRNTGTDEYVKGKRRRYPNEWAWTWTKDRNAAYIFSDLAAIKQSNLADYTKCPKTRETPLGFCLPKIIPSHLEIIEIEVHLSIENRWINTQ